MFKFSNYLHHLEFEESRLTLKDMEKMVSEKKILYEDDAKQQAKKYTGHQSLIKTDESYLPNYIIENKKKYKDWLD